MIVKIKKTNNKATIPKRATEGSNAFDLVACSVSTDELPKYIEFDTGISIEVPKGYVGLLFPRSSISNTKYSLCNSVGVIDSDYRGSIKVRLRETTYAGKEFSIGDRVAQLMIVPCPDVELVEGELDGTDRGSGGFGSRSEEHTSELQSH